MSVWLISVGPGLAGFAGHRNGTALRTAAVSLNVMIAREPAAWVLMTCPASHSGVDPVEPSACTLYASTWPLQSFVLKRAW